MMALASAFRLRRARRRPVHAGVGVVALALAVAGLAACRPQEGPGILAWRGQVADPQTIEVANPYRGSYRWQDAVPQPPAWPVRDSYRRVTWRELEPTQGNYDFSSIDEGIATARANGGVFGFRVQAACTGCAAGGVAVPDYLKDLMPKGFWFRLNNTTNYAPDWNDPDYLSRLDALLHALGQRYGNDPRVGFVDISSYGDYGEWHVHQWPYPSATGATPITTANAEAIVDMNVRAFPSKWLLMQHQTITADGANEHNVFLYALNKYPRIGIRNDCLGDTWFTDEMGRLAKAYPIVANRWKTAPVMTEYCYQSPGSGGFERASGQIAQFHVGNIGNGNMAPLRSFSVGEQRQWELNNAHSGYRFVPDHLAMPSRLSAGSQFALVSNWSNVGVTPAYNPWDVTLQLRSARGTTVWSGTSKLDLEHFLPGTQSITDTFTLGHVAPGRYRVVLVVLDPQHYYSPLALAVAQRAFDGSYPIGSVVVRRADVNE